ncbi:uncharacterized protein LOC109608019 [Aethina tumida]|uniref:uncharacterized protein LOC109608019 n=1 Tax=Aethina tumida TaxID=116153 RepID=UPI00096B1DF4|nr:uncharacterized protein LOC109608019 [Aethina tumida]
MVKAQYGEVGQINLLDIRFCDVDNPNAKNVLETEVELKEVDGRRVMNSKVNLKTQFDESFNFKVHIENTDGMKFDLAGVLCTDIFDYLPEAWEIISETLKIGKNCPIPPGEYELNNFHIFSNETGLPFVMYGMLNIQALLYQNEELVSCTEFDIESLKE